jgi:hypothetical protein
MSYGTVFVLVRLRVVFLFIFTLLLQIPC